MAVQAVASELHNDGRAERGRDIHMLEVGDVDDDEIRDTNVDAVMEEHELKT